MAEAARNSWQTPPDVLDAARRALGGRIDLDPASCAVANETVGAVRYYDPVSDGLAQPWAGRVWLNPPYGGDGPRWIAKLVAEWQRGEITTAVVLLATHHLHSAWIEPLLALAPHECIARRRIRFAESGGHPSHGSVLFGLGMPFSAFAEAFAAFGRCRPGVLEVESAVA